MQALNTWFKSKQRNRALRKLHEKLRKDCDHFTKRLNEYWQSLITNHAVSKHLTQVRSAIKSTQLKRDEYIVSVTKHNKKLSWWNTLNDRAIKLDAANFERALINLTHLELELSSAKIKLESEVEKRKARGINRIRACYDQAVKPLVLSPEQPVLNTALPYYLFPSILGLSATLTYDVCSDDDFYDALRSVNSDLQGMSDFEIWWQSLGMEPEQLAGLTALAKGAYFEQLVAKETGGELHEAFNHPDTDITIDGTEFQIKATDSVAYVNSVDSNIPVITTTEISTLTNSEDIGVSNEELDAIANEALGADLGDTIDSALDVALGPIGGLGLFASIKGLAHYQESVEAGKDKDKAADEGIEIAVAGTAKGLVDLAEFIFKILRVVSFPVIWLIKKWL